MPSSSSVIRLRLILTLAGALAGISFWLLFEILPDLVNNARAIMFIAAFVGGFFSALLLMVGPIPERRALPYAAGIGLLASVLLIWSSFRFVDVDLYADNALGFFAYALLIWLPIPFALAHESAPGGWRDYDALFDNAWAMFVRTVTAWGFVGVFWLVIFLSDALLSLVGFRYLGEFIDNAWVALPLSGLVLGLVLAVLHELAYVVSVLRRLALALLRLLLPVVTVVIALFILLVPFRGLGNVFGSFSAAAIMLGMGHGAVLLVTSAIDGTDEQASKSRLIVLSARGISILLPVIAGIALYAIWLRVAQYGWTPYRLAGTLVAVVSFLYALSYAVSVLRTNQWRRRIRLANIYITLTTLALSALWLSPVLNAERISANSHVSRFIDGKTELKALDIWRLGDDWGKAGRAVLGRLRALPDHPDNTELSNMLAAFDRGESRREYRASLRAEKDTGNLAALIGILPVSPRNDRLRDGVLSKIGSWRLGEVLASCQTSLKDGRPGCAMIFGDFNPSDATPAAILFWRHKQPEKTRIDIFSQKIVNAGYRESRRWKPIGDDMRDQPAEDIIRKVLDGDFAFVPSGQNVLQIDGMRIVR